MENKLIGLVESTDDMKWWMQLVSQKLGIEMIPADIGAVKTNRGTVTEVEPLAPLVQLPDDAA